MIAAPTPPAPARVAESFGGSALAGAVTRVGEIAAVRRSYLAQRDGTVRGDALLPATEPRPVEVARDSWATVRAAWLAQIESEGLYDRRIESWQAIAIDPRDGALMTGHAGGGAAAYTPHAWSQLVSLVATYATPRRPHGAAPAPTLGWLPPFARSIAYEGIRAMAAKRSGGLLLRGFRDPRTGLPALRAVLSPRYRAARRRDLDRAPARGAVRLGGLGRGGARRGRHPCGDGGPAAGVALARRPVGDRWLGPGDAPRPSPVTR